MINYIIIGLFIFSILIGIGLVFYLKHLLSSLNKSIEVPVPKVHINLDGLERSVRDVPGKVLQSIQGSLNVHKGALGELIGYIQLRAKYDRIIPLGNIIDFICIKFPSETDSGYIDFIDVKTGRNSRLNKDQRSLQKLIKEKKINFIELKITDEKIVGNEDISR